MPPDSMGLNWRIGNTTLPPRHRLPEKPAEPWSTAQSLTAKIVIYLNEDRWTAIREHQIETGKVYPGEMAKFGNCSQAGILQLREDLWADISTATGIVIEVAAPYPKIAYHFRTHHNHSEIHAAMFHPLL